MTKPVPARYRTTNWKSYNEALKQRGSLLIWLDKDMAWYGPRTGGNGRPAVFSDAAIQFCLMVKVLFGLAAPTNDRDGGEYSVDGWPRLASA